MATPAPECVAESLSRVKLMGELGGRVVGKTGIQNP
jgi:hypothetical protein